MPDADEFESFVREHGGRLRRLAFLLCGDAHRAEDLSQAALAKAYRHWSRIRSMDRQFAYVSRIVVREATSWRRRSASTELVSDRLSMLADTTAPDHAELVATADAVWRKLGALPPKQRACVVLRYYLDMSDEAAAQTMGCSVNTVRSNISRALATLRVEEGLKNPKVAHEH